MTINVEPYDSGSQPTLAFAPFSDEDVRRIERWQSRVQSDPRRAEAAEHLKCCGQWLRVATDGLRCEKCDNQQDWVPGVVLEVDLSDPL